MALHGGNSSLWSQGLSKPPRILFQDEWHHYGLSPIQHKRSHILYCHKSETQMIPFALPITSNLILLAVSIMKGYSYTNIIIMRRTDMKVVPLARLYQQKNDYNAHRKKLARIKSQGAKTRQRESNHNEYQKLELVRMNLEKFERRLFDRRVELARENQKIVNKLEHIKGNLNFKSRSHKISDLVGSRSTSAKEAAVFRKKENERMKIKVKSMSSQLSKGSLLKDYDRSLQIKNRLMRYQTQHNNRVVLKAGKILSSSQHRSSIISARVSTNKQKLPYINATPKAKTGPTIDRVENLFSNSISHRRQQIKSKMQLNSHKYRQMREKIDKVYCGVNRYGHKEDGPTFCTEVK